MLMQLDIPERDQTYKARTRVQIQSIKKIKVCVCGGGGASNFMAFLSLWTQVGPFENAVFELL